jgi:hypothetical protein
MVAAQSSSNLASAAGSSLAIAARTATGVRSGCGKTGCAPAGMLTSMANIVAAHGHGGHATVPTNRSA